MAKYRYLKKYHSSFWEQDFSLFFKISSLALSFLGVILVWNAITPIISYQLEFSPKFSEKEPISPLGSDLNRNNLAIFEQVLGEEQPAFELDNPRNWFPEAPFPTLKENKILDYQLSIPKLKIFDAIVKVGVEDLNKNLVQYPGTSAPGNSGNTVIFGHSVLPQFFNPKNYKTIFSTLPTIAKNDEILINYDNIRYTYKVEELIEVNPNDVAILAQRYDDSYLTLVTCVPPGTYLRRLVVRARQTK